MYCCQVAAGCSTVLQGTVCHPVPENSSGTFHVGHVEQCAQVVHIEAYAWLAPTALIVAATIIPATVDLIFI
ncbi:protein of unknown function [Legionella micdadei]|uniref:Uncharacterized protein n=1 Tax=Legionella micdadei TaxID=451 RepID=A0A098GH87_LEGMI|nr:protein of unknown function [Legionella micdadei]